MRVEIPTINVNDGKLTVKTIVARADIDQLALKNIPIQVPVKLRW